jgi:hypothetical protein
VPVSVTAKPTIPSAHLGRRRTQQVYADAPAIAVVPPSGWARCTIPVRNTGHAVPGGRAQNLQAYTGSDVYRISAAPGAGWTAWLPRTVTDVADGRTTPVHVYVKPTAGKSRATKVKVTFTSESDPTATATTSCRVLR